MIIRNSSGRQRLTLASVVVCALSINTAYNWQQGYIIDAISGHTTERYTWDSDHRLRYNGILEERTRSTRNVAGSMVNLADETPMDATSNMGMDWNFPLSKQVTIGPVAVLYYDGSTTFIYSEFGDSATSIAQSDPLWHASVSSLGWRVNSQSGDVRPWTQTSYNQQFGENIWKVQSGLSRTSAASQDGNRVDVVVGVDMLLNPHTVAYAALSQVENSTSNSNYMYTVGVSAKFQRR